MKLVYKFTLIYLIISAIVFIIGINISIDLFIDEVKNEVDYELRYDLQYLSNRIKKGVDYKRLTTYNKHIKLNTNLNAKEVYATFSDTLAFSQEQSGNMMQRKLVAKKKINGKYYDFLLYNSLVERRDAYSQSIRSLGYIYLLLFLGIGILSFFLSKWILRPFRYSLKQIESFDLRGNVKPIHSKKTTTKEFKRLNNFLEEMSSKAIKDYKSLKEFTENASHEMQTPIAVAKGKLELLSNSKNLDEQDSTLVNDVQNALSTVSNLEKSLSLLSKLDNDEFSDFETIDLSLLLVSQLNEFGEITNLKSIKLHQNIADDVTIQGNLDLMRIFLTNLIKNAIQHNIIDGFIRIDLNPDYLEISNSGNKLQVNPKLLFNRFKKNNQSSASLGLGLSIIKRISDLHHFKTNYTSQDNIHIIRTYFHH